ncbi:MAG TPA: sigma-70 family RNA polymerase sigma factor, partial [Anaerohalosphaeraceae bacterium]|nr:sigma-70 family RNA polymerase sigma factor [Anaerohalosphaeraceae bacterium]
MEQSIQESDWIQQAQQGKQEALEQLAVLAKGKLCAYLYRMSLDYDLAEDLTQESLLEMVKSINDLREPNRFWGWLYRIALNKFHTHYRREKIRQNIEQSFMEQLTRRNKALQGEQGLSRVIQSELSKAVISAIHELEPKQRAVLSLRCFDQLEYAHIAEAMETTELNARIMFFRAKQSLKKELVRQGLSKGSLLIALGFFGMLTETSEATTAAGATAVTVSTAKVSLMTAVLATCGVKMTCLLAGAAALVTVLAAVAGVYHAVDIHYNGLPKRSEVVSVHFTMQSQSNSPGTPASFSKGAYEQWYLFPEGVEGALFLRVQRWNPTQTEKQCTWLQNGNGNYYYHSGDKTLYLQNYRTWSRSLTQIRVRRLPVDEPEMTAFLDRIEEPQGEISYQQDKRTGMLKEAVDY